MVKLEILERNFRPSTYLHTSTACSRKANVSDQRIPRILWNPIFHKPLPVRIPSQINPVYIIPPQFLKTYFNVIFQTMATLSVWSTTFKHLSSNIRASFLSHLPLFLYPNVWWRVQIIRRFFMQFIPFCCYPFSLKSQSSATYPVSKHPNNAGHQFHTYTNSGKTLDWRTN